MTSDAQKLANRRYYAKVREARMAAMRERAKAQHATRVEYLRANPDALIEAKEKAVEKYYKGVVRNNKKTIDGWLADPDISETFKAFLRVNVLSVVEKGLPKKFLDMCVEHLAIAANPPAQSPGVTLDAAAAHELTGELQGR